VCVCVSVSFYSSCSERRETKRHDLGTRELNNEVHQKRERARAKIEFLWVENQQIAVAKSGSSAQISVL
jgi:hypothetical protein